MAKTPERAEPAVSGRLAALRDPLRMLCLALIGVSLCVSFARLLSVDPLQGANDISRWTTVRALVERGTYEIDVETAEPGWDTIDKVRHNDHFYSSKPPLFSTLVAGLYWAEKATLGWTLEQDTAATVRLLLVFVNLIPWGLGLWVLSEIVRRYSGSPVTVIIVTLISAWATLLTPFLSTLNNHLPAAICIIFAIDAATRITLGNEERWWWFVWCGFISAFAVTFELPAAAFGIAIFWLLFRHNRQQTLSCFLPAALLPIMAFFITNGIVTGGLRPFYMFYGTDKYVYVHNGVPSYWANPQGLDRATDSTITYFLHCTVGHHGLLSLTPVYLVSLLGWLIGLRGDNRLRPYLLLGAGLSVLVFGYYLTRTENYNYGGNTVALRWLLWLTPLWLLAMVPALDRFFQTAWLRWGGAVALLVSVFSAWYPLGDPWQSPWLMTVLQNRGWIDYRDPRPQFAHAVHSWIYQLPTGPRDDNYWVQLESIDSEGVVSMLLVKDGGPRLVSEREVRVVRIYLKNGAGRSSELTLMIDVAAFEAGEPIDRFVLWNGDPGTGARQLTARFLCGLPSPVNFTPTREVYRGAPRVRPEAFHGIIGRATVRQDAPAQEWDARLYSAQVVVSEEVPFGILLLETSVNDSRTPTKQLAFRRWSIHKAGRFLPQAGTPTAEAESAPTPNP
jgi:hypothetical protein